MTIVPKKLKAGSHIRVIAPARTMTIISEETRKIAIERLAELGLTVSFGKNVEKKDAFLSSSVSDRLEDLHDAFSDASVDAILTAIGGYNANQLLEYIDYDLIKSNPKILCGYSDITVLSLAIYSQTGLVGYSGPHFSSFGMLQGFDYTLEYFKKCLFDQEGYEIRPSEQWSDDLWFLDQQKRNFIDNPGYEIINQVEGVFEGKIIGGHLRCLNSLQGTRYWPDLADAILFIEEDEEVTPQLFDRQLQSIIHQPDFERVKALVIGRFQKGSNMDSDLLKQIVKSKKELDRIPVAFNFDLGHTTPFATLPIGGRGKILMDNGKIRLSLEV